MKFEKIAIYSPLSGTIQPINMIPDEVFSKKMVGDGIAIDPVSNVLKSPINGIVTMIHSSGHAITLEDKRSGVEILVHIGLDTVSLKGEGFKVLVSDREEVSIGQSLIEFDLDFLAENAKSLLTPVLSVSEGDIKLVKKGGIAIAGKDILFEVVIANKAQLNDEKTSVELISKKFIISNNTGLHARPSALIASEAKRFSSEIQIIKEDRFSNAKSIVGIMGLEIIKGDNIFFKASGHDAKIAILALEKILELGFEDHEEKNTTIVKSKMKAAEDENTIVGVGASSGLGVGKIFQIANQEIEVQDKISDPQKENHLFEVALDNYKIKLENLRSDLVDQGRGDKAAIFNAQLELLGDPDLIADTVSLIKDKKSAAFAWKKSYQGHADRIGNLKNELFAARAADLRDVGLQVLKELVPSAQITNTEYPDNAILVAESLSPSDTARLDKSKVRAIVTITGGATSHVAILARSLGIPAITGVSLRVLSLKNDTSVIVDGDKGIIKLHPSQKELELIEVKQRENNLEREKALEKTFDEALTLDGTHIEVAANIAGINDATDAMNLGCDGVGLLRSEFLFLERSSAPSEEDQLRTYQKIASILKDKPFIIRTLDIGGDKPLAYMSIPKEENPFLGERGIRVSLNNLDIFRTQLRAILRINPLSQVRVMFPMVSSIDELIEAKRIVEEEKQSLGVSNLELGIMIEVPSAAIMAEQFAEHVDFFSIGANDLTQYTLAVDRGHSKLAHLADGLNPSVLQLIKMTCDGAAKKGKWVGVCGGMASDLEAIAILIGLGVRELSVSIPILPLVKAEVRKLELLKCQKLAELAIRLSSSKEVRQLVQNLKKDEV